MKTVTARPNKRDEINRLPTQTVTVFVTSLFYHIPIDRGGCDADAV